MLWEIALMHRKVNKQTKVTGLIIFKLNLCVWGYSVARNRLFLAHWHMSRESTQPFLKGYFRGTATMKYRKSTTIWKYNCCTLFCSTIFVLLFGSTIFVLYFAVQFLYFEFVVQLLYFNLLMSFVSIFPTQDFHTLDTRLGFLVPLYGTGLARFTTRETRRGFDSSHWIF